MCAVTLPAIARHVNGLSNLRGTDRETMCMASPADRPCVRRGLPGPQDRAVTIHAAEIEGHPTICGTTSGSQALFGRERPNDAMTNREAAWDAVHEALPAGWTVGPPTYDPGVPGWSVTARSTQFTRLRPPQTVSGTGDSETAALHALDDRLRSVPQPTGRGWPSGSDGSAWPTSMGPRSGHGRQLGAG